jgi:alkaline phosphatase D
MKPRQSMVLAAALLVLTLTHCQTATELLRSASPTLTHGPVVGAVTPSSATVFVRTSAGAAVKLIYGQAPDLKDATTSPEKLTDASTDFTTKITLTDLVPSTIYYYNVMVDGALQPASPYPRFKTFPPEGQSVPLKLVVLTDFGTNGSSQLPVAHHVNTFKNAAGENPDLVIIGGDFAHSNDTTLEQKRNLFKLNYSLHSPAADLDDFVLKILREYPVAHMWDDHDMGANNADKTYPYKDLTRRVLQEYFPVYDLGPDGDYQSFSYGQVEFFLLDSRSQRTPNSEPNGPGKSMLGAGQLQWLEDGLLRSTATWRFILTPVVFNPTTPKEDSWYGFAYERQQIVNFIKDHSIRGVILISGDLHAGAIDSGAHSDFPEMLVPGPNLANCLTSPGTGEWSVGYYGSPKRGGRPCNGYGVVTVTTNPDTVTLAVKNTEGVTQLEYTVNQP